MECDAHIHLVWNSDFLKPIEGIVVGFRSCVGADGKLFTLNWKLFKFPLASSDCVVNHLGLILEF